MFDLNEQLNAWKQRFDEVEAIRGSDVKELEQHVRDSVAALTDKGLTPEEAFAIAIRRVGDPRPLAVEFKKVNGNHVWAQRALWMIVGFLALQIVGILVVTAANASQLVAALAGGGRIAVIAASVCVTAACWLGIAFGLVRSSRDDQGGPLGKLSLMRRWQLIALAAILPVVAVVVAQARYITLHTFMSLDEVSSIAYFRQWSGGFASVAPFVLLIVVADRLRRIAASEEAV